MENYSKAPNEKWRAQKAKLRLLFPHLDDEDFKYDYGMKDVMMDNLQAKLGKSREDLNAILATL